MAPAEIARLGGHARALSMSPRKRKQQARIANAARWARYRATKQAERSPYERDIEVLEQLLEETRKAQAESVA